MRRHRAGLVPVLVGALVLLGACGDSGPSRADVIATLADDAVPADYLALADLAGALQPAITEWCDSGDPAVATAAVDATRAGWIELRPFSFGPAGDRRSMFIIDPPTRAEDVDALADGDDPVDADSLRELAGADQRGLGAIDHLLAGEPTGQRCAYALGAADLVTEELAALAQDWESYGPGLSADDEGANAALRNIVSNSLFAVQMTIDEPDPELDEHRLAGVRIALIGGEGTEPPHDGISPLLSDELVEQLTAELDAGDAAALEITINTDVVGELGTTVNFSDADGDG